MKKVSILLATYNPNICYLERLLQSINMQEYENYELIVVDDYSDIGKYNLLLDSLKKHVKNINFSVYRNERNLGSNKTFERLTEMAGGDYFAYCDQDDIWEPYKLKLLVEKIETENSLACYSDLSIIDESDKLIANSFQKISRRVKHVYGDNLFQYFLRRKSVTGCTLLIKKEIAKKALPFPPSKLFIHDHWLSLIISANGRLSYVREPLVRYRIHNGNQIGAKILDGITNKNKYFDTKILIEKEKCRFLLNHNNFREFKHKSAIMLFEKEIEKRIDFFKTKNIISLMSIIKQLKNDPALILFEIILALTPEKFSGELLKIVKK
jgi:glycosyltransferase involved in cell wall biosynthesis